jgi:hypothetical protein
MTKEQIEILKLGIAPIDDRTILIVESALEWVQHNTTLEFDINNDEDLKALPSCVRLFIIKYFDVNMISAGVSSESIEGLSQSFDTTDKSALIWQFAEELLYPYLKSRVRFVSAKKKWR